ncbi:hypothetical protein H2200_003720 [Cladophialophora chaetospira]|uniref:DUF6604 domain-containing protein n=1 Tax=Cladophialophora chaetospira TaxID=386627 RepID=A0AA39CLD0_9EURO|nr:hypothetical protein H2200_003720 [Cladophialophora chaetospira]
MLPQYLHSTYLQYKSDTDEIATWLATTAKRCGFAADLLIATDPDKPKKLKGRARMLAKQAAKAEAAKHGEAATSLTPATKAPKYTVAVKDYLPMAQNITAFHKPPVKVPDSFAKTLDRAISLRKQVGAGISSSPGGVNARDPDDEKSDATHSFFVGVLEAVRDTLKPRMSPAASKKFGLAQSTSNKSNVGATVTNIFSLLEIEESVATPEADSQAPPVAPAATASSYEYQAELVTDLEEAMVALTCLLTDFASLRTVIGETWEGYKIGLFDLVAASIATNTALELTRRLEGEQEKAFSAHGGASRLIQLYYGACLLGENMDSHFRELPGDDFNFAMFHVADSIMLPTFKLLEAYMDVLQPGSVPLHKPGFYGVYDPSADRSKMTNREKFQEDKIVLLEILPDFTMLARGSRDTPELDEFTRSLFKAIDSKEVSLSLAFSAQVFLDIHHILRTQVVRGFSDLCTVGTMIEGSINRNFELHKNLRIDTWPASNDEGLRQIVQYVQAVCRTDPIADMRSRVAAFRQVEVERNRLMKNHPVMCGLAIYHMKAMFYEAGVTFANAWGSVLFTAHLYSALTAEKVATGRWKDMDLLLSIQDQERMFVGEAPKSADQYLRRYSLAMGYSASNFAKNKRRQNRATASAAGPRSLREQAEVSRMFMQRYVRGGSTTEMTTQDVENVLEKSNWLELDADEGDAGPVLERQTKAEVKSRLKDKWKTKQQISIPDLLRTLRMSLQAEIVEFSFDYFLMHRQCWRLLRTLKDATQPRMTEIFGQGYLERENQLPFLVGYIFLLMSQDQDIAKEAGLRLPSANFRTASRELLERAAVVLEGMISVGAEKVLTTIMRNVYNIEFELDEDEEQPNVET